MSVFTTKLQCSEALILLIENGNEWNIVPNQKHAPVDKIIEYGGLSYGRSQADLSRIKYPSYNTI